MLLGLRRMASDDQFMLAQLDNGFEAAYGHLQGGMEGFLRGWHRDASGKQAVVDKNRAWLHCVELLLTLAPEAKLIVCLRDLGQIYGSIEAQHQKTLLLDFIDHLADFDRFGRADQFFANDKVIGAPLISIHAVADLPQAVKDRLYFLRFEDLMTQPLTTMKHLFQWLGLPAIEVDPESLSVGPSESDSHYRMKYRHTQHTRITAPKQHDIPPRIQSQIESAYAWYYQLYYPRQPA
jgi:sulfotransferase